MIHVDPASPDFVKLPRQAQAGILRHQFNWTIRALADEFGVTTTTIRTWTTPGEKGRRLITKNAYFATDHGRAKRREYVRRYRAKLKAKAQQEAA